MGKTHMEATARQLEILSFISSYWTSTCRTPALRDIARHFGFSVKAAYDHVHALEKKGYIRKTGYARAILILKGKDMKVSRPVVPLTLYCKIEKERDDFFIATFPDAPNVNTFGTTRKHAIDMARDALEGCIGLDIDRGFPVPEQKYIGDDDCRIEVVV